MKIARLRKFDLVLFDPFRSDVLRSLLLSDKRYLELHTRTDHESFVFYLSLRSLFLLIKSFLIVSKKAGKLPLKHRLLLSYYSSIIRATGARQVVSMYGATNRFFALLSLIHEEVEFEAIITYQIHNRFLQDFKDSSASYSVLGDFDKEQLVSAGIKPERVRSIGSMHFLAFVNSPFFTESPEVHYDVVVLSQYQHFWEEPDCTDIRRVAERIFTEMVKGLRKFKEANPGVKICVALRPQPTEEASVLEYNYFKDLLGEDANTHFVSNVPGEFTSYQAIQKSKLVLSHYSTLAFEAFALSKPVVFCQFYDYSEKFRIPDDVPFVLREPGFDAFQEAMDKALQGPEEQFDFDYLQRRYNQVSNQVLLSLKKKLR